MVKFGTNFITLSLAIVLIILRIVGVIDFAFFGIMTAMYIVLGAILTFFFLGSGSESTSTGAVLLLMGIVMFIVLILVQPVYAL